MKVLRIFFVIALFIGTSGLYAQRGHPHKNGKPHKHVRAGRPHRVVVRPSVYRPHKVVVYHPHWRPHYGYNRRWVFFPRYNMYWDNWRNHYVFYNGTVWISQPAPPDTVKEKDLENEKQKELKEEEDDVDDVYKSNEEHKKD